MHIIYKNTHNSVLAIRIYHQYTIEEHRRDKNALNLRLSEVKVAKFTSKYWEYD